MSFLYFFNQKSSPNRPQKGQNAILNNNIPNCVWNFSLSLIKKNGKKCGKKNGKKNGTVPFLIKKNGKKNGTVLF